MLPAGTLIFSRGGNRPRAASPEGRSFKPPYVPWQPVRRCISKTLHARRGRCRDWFGLTPAELNPPFPLPGVIERRGKPVLIEYQHERLGRGDHDEAPVDDVPEAPGTFRGDRVELGDEHRIDFAAAG